jgi:CRP/FNR family cyclic AMP-dependent transcriptional regulator
VNRPSTATMLSAVPLFALLDDKERAAIGAALETRRCAAGTEIFREGTPGDEMFIVHSGRVEVFTTSDTGERIVYNELTQGEVFGELSLFDGGARTGSAVAVEDCEFFVLDGDALLKVVRQFPDVGLDFLAVMGRRLRSTNVMLRSAVTQNVNSAEEDRLTFGQRVADKVASFGGSWTFIMTFGGILVAWVVLNSIILAQRAFDPFPYILLNLFLSMLAALQAPVIMMSQNRQSSKDRLKADLDYDVNLKAELEIAQLHRKIDHVLERVEVISKGR